MATLSLDFAPLLTLAFSIVNSLWAAFIYPLAFALGFGLLKMIIKEIKSMW